MATRNPTRHRSAVTLTIPAGNEAFLRRVIAAARDGVREDLDDHGYSLQLRADLLLEEASYAALLDAVDRREVVPGDDLRNALDQLATAVDSGNEYDRVVTEHDVLAALRAQLEAELR